MVLLAGAGLLGKSLYLLLRVSTGVQSEHLITMDVSAPQLVYKTEEQQVALAREVMREIRRLPGVQSVGYASMGIPIGGNGNTTWFRVVGQPWERGA